MCENHRLDVVAGAAEDQVAYVSSLFSFLRSIIGHIISSDRARGLLDYIALLLEPVENGDDVASNGSLSSIWFAPQRWFSMVKETELICFYKLSLFV